MMKLFRITIAILFSLSWISLSAQSPQHVQTVAQKGDGVYLLLGKFQVKTPCNIAYFRKINKVRKNQGLKAGNSYILPILVYKYNGKSIRSTTGINDLPWAEKIQKYNEIMFQSGFKPNDYRTDKELWVPYHQIYCQSEDQPLIEVASTGSTPIIGGAGIGENPIKSKPTANTPLRGTYKIFGEKYARVPLESTELSGQVYYLVSGHGGPDPGAVGNYGRHSLCEDEYAYDVTLRLARNLLAYGATVYIVTRDEDDGIREGEILDCDKDETCWIDKEIPISQSERLMQRSDAINRLYQKNKNQGVRYQRLVVIHVDSNSKREKIDMFFYHKIGDSQSQAFANTIHQTIDEKYDIYRKGRGYTGTVTSRDLHMLRETEPTGVFIELGNIRNPSDQARIVLEGNRQLVANWLFEGIYRGAVR